MDSLKAIAIIIEKTNEEENQNACNLRSASGIVNGTGEENLMLAVDDQRPAVVRDAVVAGMRGPQVHKQ